MLSPNRFLSFFALLLLFVAPVRVHAQDDEEQPRLKRALLHMSVDYDGLTMVSLQVPAAVQDVEQLKRNLRQSFNFPLEFYEMPTDYSDEESEDEDTEGPPVKRHWTSLTASSHKAFSGGMMRTGC